MMSFTRAGSSTSGNCTRIWYWPRPCSSICGFADAELVDAVAYGLDRLRHRPVLQIGQDEGFIDMFQELSAPPVMSYSGRRSYTILSRSVRELACTPFSTMWSGLFCGSGWLMSL